MSTTKSTTKSYAKDFFFHLLATICFFVAVIAGINFGLAVIDIITKDPIAYFATDLYSTIHIAIAILAIVVPIYIIIQKNIIADIKTDPSKKDLPIRKWLLWFTFFVAATTLIIDGILLIYNFMSGELTLKFALKLLLIASTATFSLGYVKAEIYNKFDKASLLSRKTLATLTIVKLIAIIVIGFFITGGPSHQRDLKADQQTINHLDIIVSMINGYYIDKKSLPQDASELLKSINTFVIDEGLRKLETGDYTYATLTSKSFNLCAKFLTETDSDKTGRDFYPNNNWSHPKGAYCFERKVIDNDNIIDGISAPVKPLPYIR